MRKLALASIALFMGTCAVVNAQTPVAAEVAAVAQEASINDGYVKVQLGDLNEKLQTVLKNYEGTHEVKEIARNEEKKLVKVTLVSKESQEEKTVFLNEEGEEVKPE